VDLLIHGIRFQIGSRGAVAARATGVELKQIEVRPRDFGAAFAKLVKRTARRFTRDLNLLVEARDMIIRLHPMCGFP
jgi:hypothetical protein